MRIFVGRPVPTIMRRRIPSTDYLVAFDAAARHESFSLAARELSLTEGAVSRRIASLEEYLGVKLFNRLKGRVKLTSVGFSYSRKVQYDLQALEHDTLATMAYRGSKKVLELAVIPTFCNKWLIPRIAEFIGTHPDITVNLSVRSDPFKFDDTFFDAAIHFEHPQWSGAIQTFLFEEEVIPVCSPSLPDIDLCREPSDLPNYTLLHKSTREDMWPKWFAKFCPSQQGDSLYGPRFELFSMLITGAMHGLGIALIPHLYVEKEISAGELMIPVNRSVKGLKRYCIFYPEDKDVSIALELFVKYLLSRVGGA